MRDIIFSVKRLALWMCYAHTVLIVPMKTVEASQRGLLQTMCLFAQVGNAVYSKEALNSYERGFLSQALTYREKVAGSSLPTPPVPASWLPFKDI